MGQSSSRIHREDPKALEANVSDPSGETTTNDSASSTPATPRRSSVRRSILNLVKPRLPRSKNDATSTQKRKSWRNSMRWSKPPLDFNPTQPAITEQRSHSPEASSSSRIDSDKGKEPERPLDDISQDVETDLEALNERPSTPYPPTSQTHSWMSGGDSSSSSREQPAAEEISTSPEPEPLSQVQGLGPEPSPQPPPPLLPQQSSASPRQFPPPGTLVVVQGIVHTTDVSRLESSDTNLRPPTERSTSTARNRLSALLRPRPSSTVPSSRPSSAIIAETPPLLEHSPSGSEEHSADTEFSTPIFNEAASNAADAFPPPAPEPDTNLLINDNSNRPPAISSSSIDVLGTLLSVAAAATAASLLTGSSEPILSSGLSPQSSTTTNPLGSALGQSATSANASDNYAAGRAERMRQAWSTIRERLGLRPNPSSAQPVVGMTGVPGTPTGDISSNPVTDTRELMLAEMARAFNIGLGLNGLGSSPGSVSGNATSPAAEEPAVNNIVANPEASSTPPAVTLPPEGSFDRFLVDLQADLRIALTQGDEVSINESTSGRGHDSHFLPEVRHSSSIPPLNPARPTAERVHRQEHAEDDGVPDLRDVSDSESEFDDDDDDDDDDDSFDNERIARNSDHAPNYSTSSTSEAAGSGPSVGAGRIDSSGRINWWRLYRFPAITSPRAPSTYGGESEGAIAQHPPPPLPSSTLFPMSPSTSTDSSSTAEMAPSDNSHSSRFTDFSSAPSAIPTDVSSIPPFSSASAPPPLPGILPPPPGQTVVPVIVVGLQSVNSAWQLDPPMHEAVHDDNDNDNLRPRTPPLDPPRGFNENRSTGEEEDFDGFASQNTQHGLHQHPHQMPPHPSSQWAGVSGGSEGTNGRGRPRGWQSRAANAIRNLRPGRRTMSMGRGVPPQPVMGPGSRTFLIYVIGGYYPPDHSIVTGGPDNLESFEALLELADMLGQVKPPTVTKEDIDKSGLEIINPSQLQQYELEGKVAYNCTERCLICLDDYDYEDEVRLLSCRHAFHRNCVDKWLQMGRNNCPACRSQGVSTEPQPGHASAEG